MTLAASRLLDIKAQAAGGQGAEFLGLAHRPAVPPPTTGICSLRLANAFGSPNFTDPIDIWAWNWLFGLQYTYGVIHRPPPDYDDARSTPP